MDLQRLLETLEQRREAYRRTWRRLKRSDKAIIVALVVIGVANMIIGGIMVWR